MFLSIKEKLFFSCFLGSFLRNFLFYHKLRFRLLFCFFCYLLLLGLCLDFFRFFEAFLEAVELSSCVNQTLFPGVKGVASRTDFNLDFGFR